MTDKNLNRILIAIVILQSLAVCLVGFLQWSTLQKLSPNTPTDVIEKTSEVFDKLLVIEQAILVAAPDRWTGEDHKKWVAEFERLNPGIKMPEPKPTPTLN